jgi:hypothetical protein
MVALTLNSMKHIFLDEINIYFIFKKITLKNIFRKNIFSYDFKNLNFKNIYLIKTSKYIFTNKK